MDGIFREFAVSALTRKKRNMTKRQFFFTYIKGQGGKLVLLTLVILVSTAVSLISPQLVRRFLDEAQSKASFSRLISTALIFMGLALLDQVFALARAYVGELIAWKATNGLREDLARHCLRLDMGFHKTHKPGELLERVDNDVNETRGFFSTLFTEIAATIPLFVGVIVFLSIEDWRLGAGAGLVAVLAILVFPRINKARTPHIARVREVHAQLSGDLQEWIQGREDIQASSSVEVMLNRLQTALQPTLQGLLGAPAEQHDGRHHPDRRHDLSLRPGLHFELWPLGEAYTGERTGHGAPLPGQASRAGLRHPGELPMDGHGPGQLRAHNAAHE